MDGRVILLCIAFVINVGFLGYVSGKLSAIVKEIGWIHDCENRAYAQGWCECVEMHEKLWKERFGTSVSIDDAMQTLTKGVKNEQVRERC